AKEVAVIGVGTGGVVALCAAAVDERINRVATVGSLASYVSDVPYRGQRLGIMAPGILRDVGDIPHIAATIAPRRLVIASGVHGGGPQLSAEELDRNFEFTKQVFELTKGGESLRISEEMGPEAVARELLND